jgi:hypothetical protein
MHMIRHVRHALLAACLFSGAAHAEPVPVPKSKLAYVGTWQGKDMQLTLNQDGTIKYKRDRPNKKLDLSVDLQGFDGDNFYAGFGIVNSTFVVSKPPQRVGNVWKMTVDGVELIRVE